MKKFLFLLAGLVLTGFNVNAYSNYTKPNTTATFYGGYGNAFIFVEDGIEFSVFRDGQFDFNILRGNSRFSVSVGSPNMNISFNSGYDYNAYVQYDEFGAVIQIENTPIFYDYYGRVNQIGNVNIYYNNFGYISRLGGLYVHYNNYNTFSHCSGFINVYNRHYVYRPWHRYYVIPAYNHCVVYNRPYRQYYTPVRYVYTRPFYNNYRPITSVASRRGNTITRNSSYATVNRSSRNVTRINTSVDSRRTVANNNSMDSRSTSSNRNYNIDYSRRTTSSNTVSRDYDNNASNNDIRRSTDRTVTRTTVPNTNNSSSRTVTREINSSVTKKPNSPSNRTYTRNDNNTNRTPQVTQRIESKPRTVTPQRSVERPTQSSRPTATVSRENSNNNIQSASRRRS